MNKLTREYVINGDTATLIINKKDGSRVSVLFDTEDYNRLRNFNWVVRSKCTRGATPYILFRMKGFGATHCIYMHRLIMSFPEGMEIDHINHNGLDNRKRNLRICSSTGNAYNRPLPVTSKTGRKGVYETENGKFGVKISYNKKTLHLGRYDTLEEASKVRADAEEKYHKL